MLRTELPSSTHGVDLLIGGLIRAWRGSTASRPMATSVFSPPAAIVGLRACIRHLPGVQRALIRRTAYGRKPFGEFQTVD
ncbi:hypothetical protein [Stenotrophomonas pavanii]|uniref:hypothetical protein n=1 Tax=Stenotrophomonas pavanii TaxID=487698 RepID=UPI0039C5CB30